MKNYIRTTKQKLLRVVRDELHRYSTEVGRAGSNVEAVSEGIPGAHDSSPREL
jgi:hypothetical protein